MIPLKHFSNKLLFTLRENLRFRWPTEITRPDPVDLSLQKELLEFFKLLTLKDLLPQEKKKLRIADVGARNFYLAPVFQKFFASLAYETEIHGYEVDAHRRLRNGRLRLEYAEFFMKQVASGFFHTRDFQKSEMDFDVIFLLNPFVTSKPLLNWGLPLDFFEPEKLLNHIYKSLKSRRGILIVSSPSKTEFELVLKYSEKAGLKTKEKRAWYPTPASIQTRPRLGAVFTL